LLVVNTFCRHRNAFLSILPEQDYFFAFEKPRQTAGVFLLSGVKGGFFHVFSPFLAAGTNLALHSQTVDL
jgi:hypothetical protein